MTDQLPPPPPPASPDPGRESGSGDGLVAGLRATLVDADEWVARTDLPFDSVRSGLEWWYRPLIDVRTWTALAWLFVGAVWGPIAFSLVAVVFFTTLGLAATVIGLVLVIPAFAAIAGMSSWERARASWIGEPISPPAYSTAGSSLVSKITTRLRDGVRWRQILFFALFLVVGPVLLVVGLLPWVLGLQLVFSSDLDSVVLTPILLVAGALTFGAAPRVTTGVARAGRAFAASLLGPSDAEELQERVTELSGQRQQILDAVERERRRIERNLHDGVQQQLVALGIDIGRASARLDSDPEAARELLDAAREKVRGSIGELRVIGRGLHPAVLEDRGLDAALSAVVATAPIPITVQVATEVALPDDVASTAYYVASEAVANILKHSEARVASIAIVDEPGPGDAVRMTVHDDGRGGADETRGTGLVGMRARIEGTDGVFDVDSPSGGPTVLSIVLPFDSTRRAEERS